MTEDFHALLASHIEELADSLYDFANSGSADIVIDVGGTTFSPAAQHTLTVRFTGDNRIFGSEGYDSSEDFLKAVSRSARAAWRKGTLFFVLNVPNVGQWSWRVGDKKLLPVAHKEAVAGWDIVGDRERALAIMEGMALIEEATRRAQRRCEITLTAPLSSDLDYLCTLTVEDGQWSGSDEGILEHLAAANAASWADETITLSALLDHSLFTWKLRDSHLVPETGWDVRVEDEVALAYIWTLAEQMDSDHYAVADNEEHAYLDAMCAKHPGHGEWLITGIVDEFTISTHVMLSGDGYLVENPSVIGVLMESARHFVLLTHPGDTGLVHHGWTVLGTDTWIELDDEELEQVFGDDMDTDVKWEDIETVAEVEEE